MRGRHGKQKNRNYEKREISAFGTVVEDKIFTIDKMMNVLKEARAAAQEEKASEAGNQ